MSIKKPMRLAIPLLVLICIGSYLALSEEVRDKVLYRYVSEKVTDEPTGAEFRHTYRTRRWGARAGEKHGPFVNYRWGTDIRATQGFFLDGEPVGIWAGFDAAGDIIEWTRFEAGKVIRHEKVPPRFSRTIVIPSTWSQRNEEPEATSSSE